MQMGVVFVLRMFKINVIAIVIVITCNVIVMYYI